MGHKKALPKGRRHQEKVCGKGGEGALGAEERGRSFCSEKPVLLIKGEEGNPLKSRAFREKSPSSRRTSKGYIPARSKTKGKNGSLEGNVSHARKKRPPLTNKPEEMKKRARGAPPIKWLRSGPCDRTQKALPLGGRGDFPREQKKKGESLFQWESTILSNAKEGKGTFRKEKKNRMKEKRGFRP